MPGRFTVRPDNSEPGRFGVWDGAVNGWRANARTEAEAHQLVVDLDIQFDAHGPRPASDVRRLESPQPVWRGDSHLDTWLRDKGQWFGLVRDTTGRATWIPADQLRAGDPSTS
ncbi:hypothetical protein [Kribbella deserti]|uniref:Uncharacterized protein n=1 Tax=Kribbella deserti TaxID=1926257 RepID=A0ABV6QFG0_9ACTN